MEYFENFLGNAPVKISLSAALKTGRVSHCYMFCGDTGLGKKTLAKELAMALMCESDGEKPCRSCASCKQVEREDHPDVVYINHEKPTLFSVDEVREFSRQMNIRPYKSDRKIFILKDAQLLNMQAQNAMLKTIEEPPSYGMTILLTDNRDVFLPTVLSRCVEIDLQPVSDDELKQGLINKGIPEIHITEDIKKGASGNIGLALRLLNDELLIEKTAHVRNILEQLPYMAADTLWNEAVWLGAEKEDLPMIFSMIRNWYRDVSLCKAGGKGDFARAVKKQAELYGYDEFPKIYEALVTAERQRKVNVNPELVMELMLIKCRPETNAFDI